MSVVLSFMAIQGTYAIVNSDTTPSIVMSTVCDVLRALYLSAGDSSDPCPLKARMYILTFP